MARKSIDDKIKKANENSPYIGTFESKIDDKRRSRFIRGIRHIYEERKEGLGIFNNFLYGYQVKSKGHAYISIWDYLPKKIDYSNLYRISIQNNGDIIAIPQEIDLKGKRLIWKGKRDHFEIHHQERR